MSRSLHTQKLELRAARRMARPHSSRESEGTRLSGRGAGPASPLSTAMPVLPIRVQRPAPGCLHPLHPGDIRALLERPGCTPFYGLKLIRMRHECGLQAMRLTFAEYLVPDEIHLYAVPVSPWRLPFLPATRDMEAFARYGARCTVEERLRRATIEWPRDMEGLREFSLTEVLAHELGHHLLQHNAGKRPAQICRRNEHEAFADLYSVRTRLRGIRDRESR